MVEIEVLHTNISEYNSMVIQCAKDIESIVKQVAEKEHHKIIIHCTISDNVPVSYAMPTKTIQIGEFLIPTHGDIKIDRCDLDALSVDKQKLAITDFLLSVLGFGTLWRKSIHYQAVLEEQFWTGPVTLHIYNQLYPTVKRITLVRNGTMGLCFPTFLTENDKQVGDRILTWANLQDLGFKVDTSIFKVKHHIDEKKLLPIILFRRD